MQFTTPSARNWEEGGSFESIVEGLNELGLGVMEEEEEGVAEVEWMPPRSERESQASRPSVARRMPLGRQIANTGSSDSGLLGLKVV